MTEAKELIPNRQLLTCPKCRRTQYYVCDNKECYCHERVPKGKKPQVYKGNDILACPYCGFSAHMDYWSDRDMRAWRKETSDDQA